MLHHDAARAVSRYLAVADRLQAGRSTGFYVVGSAALDSWLAERSDIDFIAVVDGDISDRESRRLRVLHPIGDATAARRALVRADPTIPGTMNGAFVSNGRPGRAGDADPPPSLAQRLVLPTRSRLRREPGDVEGTAGTWDRCARSGSGPTRARSGAAPPARLEPGPTAWPLAKPGEEIPVQEAADQAAGPGTPRGARTRSSAQHACTTRSPPAR